MFSSKGYEATSVREICAAARITKPTLYHFFGSKEGMYRALVDGALERFHSRLVELLAAPGTTRETLRRLARGYFEAVRSDPEVVRFMLGLIYNPSSAAPPTGFARYYRRVQELVSQCLETGVASGELRPGAREARLLLFLGGLGECMCGYLITGRPELKPELADDLVDTLLDDWCAPARPRGT